MKTEIVQKALVINSKQEVLILRRSASDNRRPLQWDLPGGHLDDGEALDKGVLREVLEETGLNVPDAALVFSKTEYRVWDGGEGSLLFMFFVAYSQNDTVTLSEEHVEFEWVSLDKAIEKFEYPLHREFLEYITKHKITL